MPQGAGGTPASLRQLQNGFLTDGLAVFRIKWWGSSVSDINEDVTRKE